MDLFEVINGYAVPSVHALLIEPFRSMWEEDASDNNVDSIKAFTYIELVCSPKKSNPFIGYSEEDRPRKVKKQVWGDEDYPLNTDIILATIKYKELLSESSPSYDLYISAVNAVQKLRIFLDGFNPDERVNAGYLVMKPGDITRALKDLDDVGKNMEFARDRVHTELIQSAKTRNQREIGEYER